MNAIPIAATAVRLRAPLAVLSSLRMFSVVWGITVFLCGAVSALGQQALPITSSRWSAVEVMPVRRDLVAVNSLWRNGRIPYEIDTPFQQSSDPEAREQKERLQSAIDEWNSLSGATGVTLVHDSTATPRVLFRFDPTAPRCSSEVGPDGGWLEWLAGLGRWIAGLAGIPLSPATVTLTADCSVSTIVHEIGHAAGLRHEHQRTDRSRFLSLRPEELERFLSGDYGSATKLHEINFAASFEPVDGTPYDYRSVMHYESEFFETVPPGIPIARGGPNTRLSQGDISGLARLYGQPSSTTTVTTNPPGLEIVVDGERVPTPAGFDWLPGSTHMLEAPLVQFGKSSIRGSADFPLHFAPRYLFGNWGGSGNGEAGSMTIEVTADRDSTWFQANFIEQPWDGIRHLSPWVTRPPCRTFEQECWMRHWYRNSGPYYDNEFGAWPRAFVFVASAGERPDSQSLWLTNLSDGNASFSIRATGGIELLGTTTTDLVGPALSAVDQEEVTLESHQTARIVLSPPTGLSEELMAGQIKVCRSLSLRPDPCMTIPTTLVVTSTGDTVQPEDVSAAWPDESISFDASLYAESAAELAEDAAQDTASNFRTEYKESYNRLVREAQTAFPGLVAVQALEEIDGPYDSATVALEALGFARFMRTGIASALYTTSGAKLAELAAQDTASYYRTQYKGSYNRLVREAQTAFPGLVAVQALEEIDGSYDSVTVAFEALGFARFMRTGIASALYATSGAKLAELAAQDTASYYRTQYKGSYNRLVREAQEAFPGQVAVQALEEIDGSYNSGTVALEALGFARFMRTGSSADLFATAASDLAGLAALDTASYYRFEFKEAYNRLVREATRVSASDSPIRALEEIAGSYSSATVERSASRLRILVEREPARVAAVQRSWAEQVGQRLQECSECPEMAILPSGEFWMGSPSEESSRKESEGPVHRVSVEVPFAIGVNEVTKREFDAFATDSGHAMGPCEVWNEDRSQWEQVSGRSWRDPGFPQEDDHPVVCINAEDAEAFAQWLSRKTGHRYRLPTEAEWEYAARSGTTTPYYFGEAISTMQANFDGSSAGEADLGGTSPVGSYPANQFGLYDMHGNAGELTADCWNGSYVGAPLGGGAWRSGDCRSRVVRGGSWNFGPGTARSAARGWSGWKGNGDTPRTAFLGFRVARTLGP